MTWDLATLLPTLQTVWGGAILTFARIASIISVAPGFGEQVVPMRVKFGIALAFTIVIAPIAQQDRPPEFATLISEVLTGLFFGLFLRFFVQVLQMTGSIAAQATSLSQIFGGMAGVDPQPAMGRVFLIAGLALAAMMGLHVHIAKYILASYAMVPQGAIVSAEIAVDLGVHQIGQSFAFAFTLAAPFLIASVCYNLTLGFVNKAMPQLMVSFVGAPAITAGGLLLLLLCSPLILMLWVDAFSEFIDSPFGRVR